MSYKNSSTWTNMRHQIGLAVLQKVGEIAPLSNIREPVLRAAKRLAVEWELEVPKDKKSAENFLFNHRQRAVRWVGGVNNVLTEKQRRNISQGIPVRGVEQYMTPDQLEAYRKLRKPGRGR